MLRYAVLASCLTVMLAISGCVGAKSEPTPPKSPKPAAGPSPADSAAQTLRGNDADKPVEKTAEPAMAAGAEKPEAAAPPEEKKPTVMSALGKAVAKTIGVGSDDSPARATVGEAPAYDPSKAE